MSQTQLNPANFPDVSRVLIVLCVATFILNCVQPGWASVVPFLGSLGALGYVTFLNPLRKLEVQRGEYEALEEKVDLLREQLTATRIKIGFQVPGR